MLPPSISAALPRHQRATYRCTAGSSNQGGQPVLNVFPKRRVDRQLLGFGLTSEQFQKLFTEHVITCSMSRSGDCWDNAAMESFFSTLKTERTSWKNYQSRDEARAGVFDYIERFYNPRRRHSTLGYLSPADYEEAGALRLKVVSSESVAAQPPEQSITITCSFWSPASPSGLCTIRKFDGARHFSP
jgi:putative transposase